MVDKETSRESRRILMSEWCLCQLDLGRLGLYKAPNNC